MDDAATRTHFYHADASAIGGRIDRPFAQIVPVQAPLSLPSVGGYATARTEDLRFQGILSVQAAQTQVAGSFNERNGSWTTVVSATLEGLNILNIVTADRVVAQISTEHPPQGYTPKVSFVGTQFVNLRVAGRKLEPVIDLGFCDQGDAKDYPSQPCILNRAFLERVEAQHRRMRAEPDGPPSPVWTRYRDWLHRRYPLPKSGSDAGQAQVDSGGALNQERGMVLCSLVQEIQGDCAGEAFGHVLAVPEFGKVFLGELLLDHNSFHLVMLRLELGCPVQGVLCGGDTRTNGSTIP